MLCLQDLFRCHVQLAHNLEDDLTQWVLGELDLIHLEDAGVVYVLAYLNRMTAYRFSHIHVDCIDTNWLMTIKLEVPRAPPQTASQRKHCTKRRLLLVLRSQKCSGSSRRQTP